MSRKVLITGATGMAGSHLADFLIEQHPEVTLLGTKRWRSDMSCVRHLQGKMEFADCDLTDPSATLKLIKRFRPDFVFHLAAQSYVLDSWTNPQSTITDNINMQLNLFEALRAADVDAIIQVALSSEEYGKVYEHELPITEKNPLRPLSPYAVSKVTQDVMAYQYYESYGLRTIRTRAFNHEGPRRGEVFVTSNFAKQIAEIEAGLRKPIVYVGNLESRRDWTDVRDMVRGYWLAANHGTPGDDYVIASGVCRTIREMLDLLLEMTKLKIEVTPDPARMRPSDVLVLQGDASKFREKTGWRPLIPFQKTMSDLLDYWRHLVRHNNNLLQPSIPQAQGFVPHTVNPTLNSSIK